VLDAYRQPAGFANRYVRTDGFPGKCDQLRDIYQAVGGQTIDCTSLAAAADLEAAQSSPLGQAMHGFVTASDGTEYELALFASDKGSRAFRLYQIWPDGLARVALSGKSFAFAPALQQVHFATRRRVAADAEAATRAAAQRAESERQTALQNAQRYKALAAAEMRKQEADRRARMTPKQRMEEHIREANAKMLAYMDDVLTRDSGSWLVNRYEKGSTRNLQLFDVSDDGRDFIARADYTFNRSVTGWAEFQFNGGQLTCIAFWDSSCRPVGWTTGNVLEALFGDLP